MSDRRFILFASKFSPGTAGVDVVGTIRPQQWARFLPAAGWSPAVVTGAARDARETHDGVLVRTVPDTSTISRVKHHVGVDIAFDGRTRDSASRPSAWDSRARSLATEVGSLVPDHLAWALRAAKAGIALVRQQDAELIFSSSPSPAAHVAAWLVAIECGVPWVAELRDLWAQRPQGAGTTRVRRLPDAIAERLIFRRAAALVTVSEGLAARLREAHPSLPVHSIPTGYDPDMVSPPSTPLSPGFRLLYAGRVAERQDPGRLLRPLARAIAAGDIDRSDTRVDLLTMGTLAQADLDFIRSEGLEDVVREQEFVPRSEIIDRERAAQVLLHFRWDDPSEKGILTGKLFEYLAARRPILSTGRYSDEVSQVLTSTAAGVAPTSEKETEDFLVGSYKAFRKTGSVPYGGRSHTLDAFDACSLASRLAAVFDDAAAPDGVSSNDQVS